MHSQTVGILGGTFDPVHKGHESIADSFLSSGKIDELWVVLTPYPPHKTDKDHTGYSHRLKMLELVFQDHESVKILTIESELPIPSYTYRTIRELKKRHPNTQFLYCMGEDSLQKFHTWKYYDRILDECDLLVASRPGAEHEEVYSSILEHVIFADHEPLDISSSGIREKMHAGEKDPDGLHINVAKYIVSQHLYR